MTDFGINMFPTDKAIDPMTLAKEAEDRGFESIWFPEGLIFGTFGAHARLILSS